LSSGGLLVSLVYSGAAGKAKRRTALRTAVEYKSTLLLVFSYEYTHTSEFHRGHITICLVAICACRQHHEYSNTCNLCVGFMNSRYLPPPILGILSVEICFWAEARKCSRGILFITACKANIS
jgi:hypothetical protein